MTSMTQAPSPAAMTQLGEDWKPEANEDSDDENADFVDYPSSNWLAESEESAFNEIKSIVFDSCLKQLFRHCKMCGAIVKIVYLKDLCNHRVQSWPHRALVFSTVYERDGSRKPYL